MSELNRDYPGYYEYTGRPNFTDTNLTTEVLRTYMDARGFRPLPDYAVAAFAVDILARLVVENTDAVDAAYGAICDDITAEVSYTETQERGRA